MTTEPTKDPGAGLAVRIVERVDSPEPAEIDRIWATEAIRRRDQMRAGHVVPIPGDEVLAEVRRMVGR